FHTGSAHPVALLKLNRQLINHRYLYRERIIVFYMEQHFVFIAQAEAVGYRAAGFHTAAAVEQQRIYQYSYQQQEQHQDAYFEKSRKKIAQYKHCRCKAGDVVYNKAEKIRPDQENIFTVTEKSCSYHFTGAHPSPG